MIAGARGRRVILRAPRPGDRDEVLRLNRASRRFYRGLVMPPVTPRQWVAFLARRRRPESPGFLISRIEDGAIVGGININEIVRGVFKSGYLGYQIGAPYARRGYMTEALALTLRIAFGRLSLHRVEANIQPGNRASIALVRRAGFRREGLSPRYLKIGGRWRDHERWALTMEDWRRRRRVRPRRRP
ncbi:MAG TPA: GNAT family protein [Methylomirabilota bacterium]|nr:GNAT family protein [Methylomirabilota bacterium]